MKSLDRAIIVSDTLKTETSLSFISYVPDSGFSIRPSFNQTNLQLSPQSRCMFDMKKLLLIDALKFIPKCYKFMKGRTGSTLSSTKYVKCFSVETSCYVPLLSTSTLKGRDHGYAHARHLSLQNKFVGSTLNSKSPLPVQSLKILRFIPTSVALAGLVILR